MTVPHDHTHCVDCVVRIFDSKDEARALAETKAASLEQGRVYDQMRQSDVPVWIVRWCEGKR